MRRCSPSPAARTTCARTAGSKSIAARRAIRRWRASSTWRRRLACRCRRLAPDAALALEPSLKPVFSHATFWPQAASVSSPLGVTQAYARRLRRARRRHAQRQCALAASLRRALAGGDRRRPARLCARRSSRSAPGRATCSIPWGVKLPLAVKRGYHRHFRAQGNAGLTRPVLDGSVGYVITPMEQGIRMTTGVEFAARDAPPTPVQFDRIMPKACELFPLGERADDKTWLGRRPVFPDSRPVIGRAPGKPGLWLAIGHAALGADARAFDRASARRHDHRRRPLRRSGPIPGGAVSLRRTCRSSPAARWRKAARSPRRRRGQSRAPAR